MGKSKVSVHTKTPDQIDKLKPRSMPTKEPIESLEEDNFDGSSESSEEEDEDGDLVTENIDKGITEVLAAIRSNPEKLKDPNVKFFPEIGSEGTAEAQGRVKREKPMYLKDYQREQVLSGNTLDNESNGKPETYSEEQARLKSDIIRELHKDDDDNDDENGSNKDDDEDGDGLLQKRTTQREIPGPEEGDLPDPEQDASAFLEAFISKKAWAPSKKESALPTYSEVVQNGDEDSDEFDDLSEKFESAYNFRYEDPNAEEIISYARDQSTLRRGKMSSRQKKREKQRQEREQSKEQQKLEMAKLRKSKVNEITDRLAQLQEALGEGEDKVAELLSKEDLDGDFDTAEWDRRMQKLFDDEYYGRGDKDAIGLNTGEALGEGLGEDLGEDLGEEVGEESLINNNNYNNNNTGGGSSNSLDVREEPVIPEKKLSKKELKRKAEQFVDENQDLLIEQTTKPKQVFKYQEVEPESFGLTSRDILLASDKDLNRYAGLKKLASYRDRVKMEADRRKYSKRKRLRQWRKEVFGVEDSPTDDLWEKAKLEEAKQQASTEQPKHKSKKRKHR